MKNFKKLQKIAPQQLLLSSIKEWENKIEQETSLT
jgi:hypothetical protein